MLHRGADKNWERKKNNKKWQLFSNSIQQLFISVKKQHYLNTLFLYVIHHWLNAAVSFISFCTSCAVLARYSALNSCNYCSSNYLQMCTVTLLQLLFSTRCHSGSLENQLQKVITQLVLYHFSISLFPKAPARMFLSKCFTDYWHFQLLLKMCRPTIVGREQCNISSLHTLLWSGLILEMPITPECFQKLKINCQYIALSKWKEETSKPLH